MRQGAQSRRSARIGSDRSLLVVFALDVEVGDPDRLGLLALGQRRDMGIRLRINHNLHDQ